MRDIKFRGQKVDNGEWVEGYFSIAKFRHVADMPIFVHMITPHEHDLFTDVGTDLGFAVIPETVGQFTGLQDKNGAKIFEGDVLLMIDDFYRVKSTVIYSESKGAFHAEGTTCDHLGGFVNSVTGKNRCEIIGNIHDNKELIK